MRALLTLALVMLASLSFGAKAASYPTVGAAHQACINDAASAQAWMSTASGGWNFNQPGGCLLGSQTSTYITWKCSIRSGSDAVRDCRPPYPEGSDSSYGASTAELCSSGQEWDAETMLCKCPGGYKFDPYDATSCMDDSKCRALNSGLGGASRTMAASSYCPAVGCQMRVNADTATTRNGQGGALVSGMFEYTGESCSTSPTNPEPAPDKLTPNPPPQECVTYSTGQAFCQKRDGQQCYTTSNGRQSCWKPGETGEKTDGQVMQKRNAGPTEVPPQNLQLPSGDSLQKSGQSVTDTTTSRGTTITTTTTNYTTTNGTNASGGDTGNDSGESGTGDGTGQSGDGDDKGSASGGGNCETPPVTTGDPVLGMVATQTWHTRCAVEAGNAAKVTGDVGDCSQPFTVEGTNANAHQLRAMRAAVCGQDANGNKRPDWTETNGTETPEPGEGEDEPGVIGKLINTDALDAGGFLGGGASCPAMGVVDLKFAQVDLSAASWWCPFVSMCRAILLLMGAFIAIRLLME